MALLNKTVGEIVRDQASKYPNQEAYVYPEHDIRKTYKEFDAETDLLAKAFIGMGIEKGDNVAIWSRQQTRVAAKSVCDREDGRSPRHGKHKLSSGGIRVFT